jgi:hypothetical protein
MARGVLGVSLALLGCGLCLFAGGRSYSSVMATVPLTALLSWAWIAAVMEVDNAVEAAGADHVGRLFKISFPMWANALRLVDDEGIAAAELGRRAGAACNLGGLERWGWISVGGGAGRRAGYGTSRGLRADTVIAPTRAGRYARRLFPEIVGIVEQRWRDRFGAEAVDSLRDRLTIGVRAVPWSPPEVHPSDGFITHVTGGGDSPQDAPLVVLLGQRLTQRTVQEESSLPVSLPLAANLLRAVDGEQVAVVDLPARTGLSKEAIAMAVGNLNRRHLAAVNPDRTISLTAEGRTALQVYRDSALRRGDGDDLREALEDLLHDTKAIAAGLRPPEGCWRSRRPHLARTARLLADPTGTLPWHPMVLHRGGWPDGS